MDTYSLHNDDISVSVRSYGAELISLKNKTGNELIWQAEKTVWSRHAPVLFPVVGRLKSNTFNFEGQAYTLLQHGFARDHEFVLIEQKDHLLSFELVASEETMKIFPFHFSLIITYQIESNQLRVKYKVFNPDSKDLYFSIGAHPGFRTDILPGETLSDYGVKIEGKDKLTAEILTDGLLSGETRVIDLKGGILQLDKHTFDHDAVVFKNSQINRITLFSSKSGNKIEMNCKGWPYFGIWSKKDCDRFVCLEPWCGITDSVTSSGKIEDKEGIIRINHYSSFEKEFSIEI